MQQTAEKERITFTDRLRVRFKGVLDAVGAFLNRLGLHPNMVTLLGLVGNMVGAVLLGWGYISWGGIVVLVVGPIDALDGTMARLRGQITVFGAFFDSVTDRYSELVIYFGLLIHFLLTNQIAGAVLVYLAAAGSVLVSYVKARAEGLGLSCKVGLLTRAERYLVLAPLLVINQPLIALVIIAVLANVTALQRIIYIHNQTAPARLVPTRKDE